MEVALRKREQMVEEIMSSKQKEEVIDPKVAIYKQKVMIFRLK